MTKVKDKIIKGIVYIRSKKPSSFNYADALYAHRFVDLVEKFVNGENEDDEDDLVITSKKVFFENDKQTKEQISVL